MKKRIVAVQFDDGTTMAVSDRQTVIIDEPGKGEIHYQDDGAFGTLPRGQTLLKLRQFEEKLEEAFRPAAGA